MLYRAILLLGVLLLAVACSKDDGNETPADYRLQYVGIYDCKKSNDSFDSMFATDLEVSVEIATDEDSIIIINDNRMPIGEDGTFGLEEYNGSYYELSIDDDELKLIINLIFPLGDAIPCFIKGTKRN